MSNWLWLDDDEPTDEELDEIEWDAAVYPDGFCRACGAPTSEAIEYSECSNCGHQEWF